MKRWLGLLAFCLVLLLVWQALWPNHPKGGRPDATESQPYVEYFINRFRLTALDETGKVAYTLVGDRLERYSDQRDAVVLQPVFELRQPGQRWRITARRARLNNREHRIVLQQDVVMKQLASRRPVTVDSEQMTIQTRRQIVTTERPVHFRQGESRMHGTGMVYRHRTGQLVLKKQVHGHLSPAPASDTASDTGVTPPERRSGDAH